MWFTAAECVASKLLTGSCPKIVEAVIFEPGKAQSGLRPVTIAGHKIDPVDDDFYKALIEARDDVKRKRDGASGHAKDALDAEQKAIKIIANGTSYGIFMEVNVKDRAVCFRVRL